MQAKSIFAKVWNFGDVWLRQEEAISASRSAKQTVRAICLWHKWAPTKACSYCRPLKQKQKRTNQGSSSDLLWPMLFWWLGLSFRLVVVKQKLFSQKSFSTVTETIVYFRSQVSHSYRSSLLCVTTKMKAAVHTQTCRSSLCEHNAARHPSSPWPKAVGAAWLACVSIHKMAKCGLYCISAP